MQIVENLIQRQVRVLLLVPNGSKEIVPAVLKANAAKIPVVVVDTRVDAPTLAAAGASVATFIGSDNEDGGRMAGAFLVKRLGLDAQGVTYRSPPQALTDVMAGVVPFMFIDMSAVLGHVRAGAVRALAVTSAAPSALLPQVPSLASTVLPGFELLTWMGLYGPAGLPAPMVTRLNTEARAALARPEVVARLLGMGFETQSSTPEELADFTRSEIEKWRGLVAETGMEVT